MNAKQTQFINLVNEKNKLKARLEKHNEFYFDEAQFIYGNDAKNAIILELDKMTDLLKATQKFIAQMNAENNWSAEEMKEMKKSFK